MSLWLLLWSASGSRARCSSPSVRSVSSRHKPFWVIDFLSNLIGHPLTGLTDYMFMADHSLFLRGLSLFHGWLPLLLVYLVWRLGYDGRALAVWTLVAWALVLISFFF